MRRFVTGDDAYDRVSLREGEFEKLIPRYWARLSSGWSLVEWKPLLDSPHGRVRPDGMALNAEGDRWIVVEVELASHPESHFRNQFQALESAYYGRHLVERVAECFPDRPRQALDLLLSRERPSFLCIADEATDSILHACTDFGFQLAIMTPYRSTLGDYGISVSRMPRDLVEPRRSRRYMLALGEGQWGGRFTGQVPNDFPNWTVIYVRYRDTVYDLHVTAMGRVRRVFLPSDYEPVPGSPAILTSLDPARGIFELGEGK